MRASILPKTRGRTEQKVYSELICIHRYASELNRNQPASLSNATIDKLMSYHWPGNVRELQNVLRRIIVFSEGKKNLDKIINLANFSRHNNIEPNFRTGLGFNGDRIDLADFSLKKFKKQASDQVESNVIS